MKSTDLETMLDSGAYSAWSKGKRISLEDYVEFILTRGTDTWTTIVNLDVIPGKKGKKDDPPPTSAEWSARPRKGGQLRPVEEGSWPPTASPRSMCSP